MKLEGTLATFPLRELIDMIIYSSVTGALNMYAGERSGHLYFRDGHLYHVDFAEQIGTDGLADLLELSDGGFAFVSDQISSEESMWGDLDFHLQTAERLAMRWRQVRAYVPSMAFIPQVLLAPDQLQRRVSPLHLPFLEQLDGVKSLQSVATELGWSAIDVAEAAAQLVLDGVIDLRRTAAPARQRSEEPSRSEGGLFERIIRRNGTGHPVSGPTPATPATSSPEDAILQLLRG
ncbi:MAG: DUF4388 domain-containing protein [Oscillochloris sp.]|nr:DUF4388 domain-containing protein [Oscillochloris sp.]